MLSWGKHWKDHGFDEKYGERTKWVHNYPDIFPQSASNPQNAWCYPDRAFAEFRRWFCEDYVEGGKLLKYVDGKIRQKALPPSFSQIVTKAHGLDDPKRIGGK